jgi:hypothetical protein
VIDIEKDASNTRLPEMNAEGKLNWKNGSRNKDDYAAYASTSDSGLCHIISSGLETVVPYGSALRIIDFSSALAIESGSCFIPNMNSTLYVYEGGLPALFVRVIVGVNDVVAWLG